MPISPLHSSGDSVQAFWEVPASFSKEKVSFQDVLDVKPQTQPSSPLFYLENFGNQLREHDTVLEKALNHQDNPLKTLQSVNHTRLLVDFVRAVTKVSVESLKQLFQTSL
jgi:hypothetical protein